MAVESIRIPGRIEGPIPERIEGPTPAGGAYALVYRHDDGSIEIVEFDEGGREIRRTYSGPPTGAGS